MHRIALLLSLIAAPVLAQLQVKDPWVRATVAQQKVTGAFMVLSSQRDVRLVEARTAVAGTVEIHEMAMDQGIMRMRPISGVDLPAGKTVELKPGGYHVMLLDLKRQLKEGEILPITLVVEGKDKQRQTIEVKASVRPLNTAAHGHKSH